MQPEEADRLIAINFGGVVNGIYLAMPLLRATPGSAILNTGSASFDAFSAWRTRITVAGWAYVTAGTRARGMERSRTLVRVRIYVDR